MALPASYSSAAEYFEEALHFLCEYQHLYKFPNTDILIENVLDEIPPSSNDLDVFDSGFDLRNVSDEYFAKLLARLERLAPAHERAAPRRAPPAHLAVHAPLSLKKQHEIVHLADELSAACRRTGCRTIVDFGSGLGYLDQQLFATTPCRVLGLECNENHYVEAKKRQRKYHPESVERVKFVRHTVSGQSAPRLRALLADKFPDSADFCIAGLHACADLSVDAIDAFLSVPGATALVIMPCCYHRLHSEDGVFRNFPLSECLRAAHAHRGGAAFLGVPFLRLATQPQLPAARDLRELVFGLLARAVLQLHAFKRNCKLRRKKRKGVRIKSVANDFETYVTAAAAGFALVPDGAAHAAHGDADPPELALSRAELDAMWCEISQVYSKRAAIFILLQNYFQPVFENIVLFDRLCYLKEKGIQTCMYKRILDNSISPRCLSLVAFKNNKELQ